MMAHFTALDTLALGFFFVAWIGYMQLADRGTLGQTNMANVMSAYRLRWMRVMTQRELRIVDTTILGNLLNGTAFFASTAILLVGGLFALLGASDKVVDVLNHLPLVPEASRALWEVKIGLLIVIFIYAFFKFAWAYRLFNYCSVLVGATPIAFDDAEEAEKHAVKLARINHLAAEHFNNGMRSYFFSLATLGWFLHPAFFLVSIAWVIWVLYRREFRSKSLKAVSQ